MDEFINFRGKVKCTEVKRREYGGDVVTFEAQYGKSPEDNSFAEATPTANFTMTISNKNLMGKIQPGQEYYVDFTPILPPAAAVKPEDTTRRAE